MARGTSSAPVQKGELRTVTVEALGTTDAVARVDGYVVLVPGLLPGERALVRITSAARKFGRGELVQVLTPSADRAAPRCRHFLDCGGCHYQHLAYAAQALHKQQRLQQTVQRVLGEQAPEVQPTLVPADPYGQRHKVALHLTGDGPSLAGGFRKARSADLVVLDECPASDPQAFALARATVTQLRSLGLPATDRPGGVLRSVVVRRAAGTGEAAVVVVVNRGPVRGLKGLCPVLHQHGATAIAANVNDGDTAQLLGPETILLSGPERIRERIGRITYALSPASFFQTAPWGAERLVELVQQALAVRPTDHVLDLYCGGGLFALALAPACHSVLGIEENPTSAADAVATAELLDFRSVRVLTGRVEDRLRSLQRGGQRADRIVLDPPRAGCGPELAAAIAGLGAAAIAYVSCDPDALARDLAAFGQNGYQASTVTPVDMFPHTHHVEAVASLRRS